MLNVRRECSNTFKPGKRRAKQVFEYSGKLSLNYLSKFSPHKQFATVIEEDNARLHFKVISLAQQGAQVYEGRAWTLDGHPAMPGHLRSSLLYWKLCVQFPHISVRNHFHVEIHD